MSNTSPSDFIAFVVAASKIRVSIKEIASQLRRLGHKDTTPAGVKKILLDHGCHIATIIDGYEWNRWSRRYVAILVMHKVPIEIMMKTMKKRGNLDFTKEKIEEIEKKYKSIISALKESSSENGYNDIYSEVCAEYIRQAYELGFLMADICSQLEKAGFAGPVGINNNNITSTCTSTWEVVRDVLVEYGYNHVGVIPGRLGTIREGRPISEKTEKYVKAAYIMGISIEDMAFQLHILGFTDINCYNYIFNVLVDHGLLLSDDSTLASGSTGAITPTDYGDDVPGDHYILDDDIDDLDNIEEYNDTI